MLHRRDRDRDAFSAGAVTVPDGGTVVCTITNNDQQGTLQIVKKVANDNGGTRPSATSASTPPPAPSSSTPARRLDQRPTPPPR